MFKFIYKNVIILDFKKEPPYEFFITLLIKKKILLNDKNMKKFKLIWTKRIKEYLNSNQKYISSSKLIQNLFHDLVIVTFKNYFDYIKYESLSY